MMFGLPEMEEEIKKLMKYYNNIEDDILLDCLELMRNREVCIQCRENKNPQDPSDCDCVMMLTLIDAEKACEKLKISGLMHENFLINESSRRWYNAKSNIEKFSGNTNKYENEIEFKKIFSEIFIKTKKGLFLKIQEEELKEYLTKEFKRVYEIGQKSGLSSLLNLGT